MTEENIKMEKREDTSSGIGRKLLLLSILVIPSLTYLIFSTGRTNFISLPILGPRQPVTKTVDGKTVIDTVYHTIPEFAFINQDGKTITQENYKDKIYVADFFFTTCQSICPKMTSNMLRVQEKFKDRKSLMFLSHTVNPEEDSVEVLANYAREVHANTATWNFVTGDKTELYNIGRKGYFLPVEKLQGGPEEFLHSEYLVLIDKEKRIRGVYDGTTVASVDSLIDDIKILMADYERRNKERNKLSVGKPDE
jgi:protein SCO1